METVGQPPGSPNAVATHSFHVATGDIANIAPCDFPEKSNPITKVNCRSTFTTLKDMEKNGLDTSFRKKRSTKANYNNVYIFICGLLLIYLLQKLLKKN